MIMTSLVPLEWLESHKADQPPKKAPRPVVLLDSLIKEKRSEIQSLQDEIDDLEDEISKLEIELSEAEKMKEVDPKRPLTTRARALLDQPGLGGRVYTLCYYVVDGVADEDDYQEFEEVSEALEREEALAR